MLDPSSQFHGILPTRGGLMLDVVFLAMFAIVPVLLFSIGRVRYRDAYGLHKQLQLTLAGVLLIAVTAFEIDLRFFTDWQTLAEPSPYFGRDGWSPVWISLFIHLSFAVPTLVLWIGVVIAALRNFPTPVRPAGHSRRHRFWGQLAAVGMVMTALTGWIFYWLAFVA